MAIDAATVKKVNARLARIQVAEAESWGRWRPVFSGILAWIEQLNEVDTKWVAPMAPMQAVSAACARDGSVAHRVSGGDPAVILANAPKSDRNFFVVPKVVE